MDLRVGERLVLHRLGCAKCVASMDHRDLRRKPRQIGRLFHRRVTAADHGDLAIAEEKPVAGRAGGHAVAHQQALGRQSEQSGRRSRRDDDRPGRPLAIIRADEEGADRQVDRRDLAGEDLGPETLGLGTHFRHQRRTHDPVAKAGPVLDHRGQRQLATSLQTFDDQRMQTGPGRIERRRETGRSRPDDDDLPRPGHGQMCFSRVALMCCFEWPAPARLSTSCPPLNTSSAGIPRML